MDNKNNLSKHCDEYIDPIIIQERVIDELLESKEKLQKMIIDAEELKKEKSLNWIIPLLGWNALFSLVIGILVGILVSFGGLPSSLNLPIFGKVSTVLVSLIGINIFSSLGAIENIDFNYRYFNFKLEEQKVNEKKLKVIENKIKLEQEYLEKLKQEKQNTSNEIETSSLNELARLKLLKSYLLKYVDDQYISKSFHHDNDILKWKQEMEINYPYNSFDKKKNEIEEGKKLLKKRN